jgi:hypothetical protein
VCVIKCHRISVLLASAVLSGPSGEVYAGFGLSNPEGKRQLGKPRHHVDVNIYYGGS